MKSGYLLAALAAFAVATPALAGDKDQKSGQDAPKEKKVCHTETVTGSLIARQRICKTQAEWDELAAATKRNMDNYTQRQGMGGETGGANGANNTAGL
ncbi:MAG TPA: hypothetical protein VIC34_08125 [Croceibacterium sp.]|jgi:hypothetical protein